LVTPDIPGTLLLDPGVIEDPYPFYRQLQMHAPVWRVPDREVFTVSSFALLADAVARVDDFSSNMRALLYRDEEGLPGRLSFGDAGVDVLATADPPDHKMHRDVVFSELVAKRMAALEPEIAEVANHCLGRALKSEDFDFMAEVGNILPITFITRLIGFPDCNLDTLLRAAFDSTSMLGATSTLSELNALVAQIGEIEAWIANHVAAVIGQPDDNILGAAARGIDAGVFTVHQACVVLHTLLSAGGESTTSLLGNAVRLLAENRDLQDRLRGQPDLVPAFIEEALRLESPFRFLIRFVPETTLLGGMEIPSGATVLLLWGAANRDPAEFEDPNKVDLDRRVLRRHVAFGRGMHYCVGATLARLEARVVLEILLDRTSSITLDPGNAPRRVESLMVRRHEQLPVRVTPR
jgi:cytochrome P450